MATSPYLKEHQNGKMGKIGLRDARPVSQNPLIGFPKTVHKLFKFQEIFFFKQNYRLTIIHSQTYNFLVIHSNCHKNLVIYILSIFYIDYRYTLNFPHTIQALIPFHLSKPPQKLHTTVQYLHTLSKMYLHMFFFIYSLPKTKISTQTFQIPLIYLPVHNLFRVSTILHKFIKFKFTN